MTKKEEYTRYTRWVKINFVQIGDMWTKRENYNPKRLYSDGELFDYYNDWLANDQLLKF